MGKQDKDKNQAGKSAVGVQDLATSEIKTVEELESLYPQLVGKIKDDIVRQVGMCTAGQVKKNMPDLYERIVIEIQGRSGPDLNVPGFLLEVDDPVAAGTLRAYQREKGLTDLRLPYVLPYKDKKTKAALENYILRADGCGDTKRADAAREAMKKIK